MVPGVQSRCLALLQLLCVLVHCPLMVDVFGMYFHHLFVSFRCSFPGNTIWGDGRIPGVLLVLPALPPLLCVLAHCLLLADVSLLC